MDDDADATDVNAQIPPDKTPEELLSIAQARVDGEVATLLALSASDLARRLLATAGSETVSFGALVYFIQLASAQASATDGTMPAVSLPTPNEMIDVLLERIKGLNEQWVRSFLALASKSLRTNREPTRDDLLQQLKLILLERIVVKHREKWQLFFRRSLFYAQRDAAHAFLRSQYGSGFTPAPPGSLDRILAQLPAETHDMKDELWIRRIDLMRCFQRLTEKQQVVIIKRYWDGLSFTRIADEQSEAENTGKKVGEDAMRKRHDKAIEALRLCCEERNEP